MGELVDLKAYREKSLGKRAFAGWKRRFGEHFDNATLLADISDRTLLRLALPGEKSDAAFYDLILGALGLGDARDFSRLERGDQVRVVDIHLFMADHVRFEMMLRLRWLSAFPCREYRLVDMVLRFDTLRVSCSEAFPIISRTHRMFDQFLSLPDVEKQTFVRSLLPEAIDLFKSLVG